MTPRTVRAQPVPENAGRDVVRELVGIHDRMDERDALGLGLTVVGAFAALFTTDDS